MHFICLHGVQVDTWCGKQPEVTILALTASSRPPGEWPTTWTHSSIVFAESNAEPHEHGQPVLFFFGILVNFLRLTLFNKNDFCSSSDQNSSQRKCLFSQRKIAVSMQPSRWGWGWTEIWSTFATVNAKPWAVPEEQHKMAQIWDSHHSSLWSDALGKRNGIAFSNLVLHEHYASLTNVFYSLCIIMSKEI